MGIPRVRLAVQNRQSMGRRCVLALALMLISLPGAAQPNNKAYLDLLLFSQYGEFCTMCEAVLLCETGDKAPHYTAIPDSGSFTLFHIETRTFWSQMATIWEWFMRNFRDGALSGHTRPVNRVIIDQGQWSDSVTASLHLALEPPLLTIGNQQIERRSRRWLVDGQVHGYCQRLPLWESLETINNQQLVHDLAGD